jgi:predicted lipid-binding transport protein (Tim44 family)
LIKNDQSHKEKAEKTMRIMYRAIGIAVVSLELLSTTGCVAPNGQPDNTATGALAGGLTGALIGGLTGGRHGGRDALIGGLVGVVAGGLIGHMIDQEQQQRLQAQSPQTLATIQHNDAVYQQQQAPPAQPTAAPAPDSAPAAQAPGQAAAAPAQAQPEQALIPLTVEDIKALDSAGVKKDVIIAEIQRSKSVFTQADITALQQSNPNIDAAVIECMKKTITG